MLSSFFDSGTFNRAKKDNMKQYYEGWYMKQQQGDDVFAIIPGRSRDESFIQVITPHESFYIPYPLKTYLHNQEMLVGSSLFTRQGMDLDIRTDELTIYGHLQYDNLSPLRYNIMGPFSLLPMETKHTVFSMRHSVRGELIMNGEKFSFTSGLGYMEGDRGHSFPRRYTWFQSVDFESDCSVMAAIADIPLAGFRFMGCIAVVYLNGKEFRFATYLGVHIVSNNEEHIEIRQGDMVLQVDLLEKRSHRLQAPVWGEMIRPIQENPAIPAKFRFTKDGKVLLDELSEKTSFEFVQPEDG